MHATQVATPFHRPGWVYEEKVDGYRMAALIVDDSPRLISRNGIQHTKRFPQLVEALAALPAKAFILDGEVAVYDQALISRFEWLRGRPKDAVATEPVYMVFDVLEVGGKDLRREPLWKRRKVLEELVAGARMILPARRLSDNGLKAWAQAVERGYEGMVGKDPESLYVPGRDVALAQGEAEGLQEGSEGVLPGVKLRGAYWSSVANVPLIAAVPTSRACRSAPAPTSSAPRRLPDAAAAHRGPSSRPPASSGARDSGVTWDDRRALAESGDLARKSGASPSDR
jgi:hypothetical protein